MISYRRKKRIDWLDGRTVDFASPPRHPKGPLTITWDVVPEATGYCVAVWHLAGYQGPYCLPGTPGERITTNRFTTPPLNPDLYTVSVVAVTDVIIGDRIAKPLSFTVTAP